MQTDKKRSDKRVQRMLSYVRRAVDDYNMINEGDKIAVGVSGGKDSMMLLSALSALRRFYPKSFEIVAITLDPQFKGVETDYSEIEQYCKEQNIEYHIKRTEIGSIIFDVREEKNPCSLCARMRRGALHDASLEYGCSKIARGHHYNDVVETFLMNLFLEGRVGCFSPVTYLSRKDIYMIRPLIYIPENEIEAAVKRIGLPVVKSVCPADKVTKRQETKDLLSLAEIKYPGITERVFGALVRLGIDGWQKGSVKGKNDDT